MRVLWKRVSVHATDRKCHGCGRPTMLSIRVRSREGEWSYVTVCWTCDGDTMPVMHDSR